MVWMCLVWVVDDACLDMCYRREKRSWWYMEGATMACGNVADGCVLEVCGCWSWYYLELEVSYEYSSKVLILFVFRVQVSCAVNGGENLLIYCWCAGDRWMRRRASIGDVKVSYCRSCRWTFLGLVCLTSLNVTYKFSDACMVLTRLYVYYMSWWLHALVLHSHVDIYFHLLY
jgi:hypothetical protein